MGEFFTSLTILQRERVYIQLFPFIMVDDLTSLVAALHLEQGEEVNLEVKLVKFTSLYFRSPKQKSSLSSPRGTEPSSFTKKGHLQSLLSTSEPGVFSHPQIHCKSARKRTPLKTALTLSSLPGCEPKLSNCWK